MRRDAMAQCWDPVGFKALGEKSELKAFAGKSGVRLWLESCGVEMVALAAVWD